MPARIFKSPSEFLENSNLKNTFRIVTSGGFDPLHIGHLRCIQASAAIKNINENENTPVLIVIVNDDNFLLRKKGHFVMTWEERAEIVASIEGVDYVVGWDDGSQTVIGALDILQPSVFTKGGDRSDRNKVPESEICDLIGCHLMFGVGGDDKIQSSSDLLTSHLPVVKNPLMLTKKPWGQEILFAFSKKCYAGKVIEINENSRLSLQYHKVKNESIYVISGKLFLTTAMTKCDQTVQVLSAGDTYHILAGVMHRFEARQEPVVLIEVSTPELADVVRVADDFGRANDS